MTQLEKQLNRKEGKNRDADADSKENEDPIQRKVMNKSLKYCLLVALYIYIDDKICNSECSSYIMCSIFQTMLSI